MHIDRHVILDRAVSGQHTGAKKSYEAKLESYRTGNVNMYICQQQLRALPLQFSQDVFNKSINMNSNN